MRNYTPFIGANIWDACAQLACRAPARMDFNGIEIVAVEGDTAMGLANRYYLAIGLDGPHINDPRKADADTALRTRIAELEGDHVALMRVSGALVDAGVVVVEPYDLAVRELTRQLAQSRADVVELAEMLERYFSPAAEDIIWWATGARELLIRLSIVEARAAAKKETP